MTKMGSCNCGAVQFEADNLRESVAVCHCTQCRKFSGHLWAATRANLNEFRFLRDDGLTWYQSSDHARRGFCRICGSAMFYQPNGAAHIGIAAGCVEQPTGLTSASHIYTKFKGDYYKIADNVPQFEIEP